MPIRVYLTIDDAPSQEFPLKLRLLEQHNIPAVWFCQGNHIATYPKSVIDAIKKGYVIGNHSYSHPSFADISIEQGFAEISSTDDIITKLYEHIGIERNHRYFRFPYGNKGDSQHDHDTSKSQKRDILQNYLRGQGYSAPPFQHVGFPKQFANHVDWYWTFDTNDWMPFFPELRSEEFKTPELVIASVHKWLIRNSSEQAIEVKPHIILMHDLSGQIAYQLFKDLVEVMLLHDVVFCDVNDL
ncbi:MAG: polysaccharide deacetylase family protein [Aggregatilineales bacterium]